MRIRISSAIFTSTLIISTLLLIYQIFNLNSDSLNQANQHNDVALVESRIHQLEDDMASNQKTMVEVRHLIQQLMNNPNLAPNLNVDSLNKFASGNKLQGYEAVDLGSNVKNPQVPLYNLSKATFTQDDCQFAQTQPSSVDLQMNKLHEIIPFDNPDGGAWKQGWDITYNPSQWSPDKKLKVFVAPHSHNDPGWIKTFERYFNDQTKNILDNMVKKLQEDHRRKFIWAEISYFSLWWDRQSKDIKEQVKSLVDNGQLEIVTGGWVMPDEANCHYFGLVDQLITGHEWLLLNLGVKPNNGWSIDPFGLSPTMAYLLKMAGFENMLIQRTHYSIKKYFAKEKSLEFRWRQLWDTGSNTDILCHMMPFYSYDVPHTCGPDPKVCCQFDFRRLPGSGMTCPWRIPPQPINEYNVESRSKLLLDQYRKKAQLYSTNALLVPLGDDFRYDSPNEWDQQYTNYQALFDYMNSRDDWHVHAQFGTLADYFRALREEASSLSGEEDKFFPSFSGDFFSYADRDQHYWSGYYTSRPFYKRMDRILHSYMRSAEIMFSLMLDTEALSGWGRDQQDLLYFLMDSLTNARRDLGLFQHHDGITGTSKNHVVVDYANRMLAAIRACQHAIQQAANSLLIENKLTGNDASSVYFELGEDFKDYNLLAERKVISTSKKPSTFYIFNPEEHKRQQLLSIMVDSPYIEIRDRSGEIIYCQIDPQFDKKGDLINNLYKAHFVTWLDPLSLSSYTITGKELGEVNLGYIGFSSVTVKNMIPPELSGIFPVVKKEGNQPISLHVGHLMANFSSSGLLQHLSAFSNDVDVKLQFMSYGARGSGAYLFLPNGNAREILLDDPPLTVVEGPLTATLSIYTGLLQHHVTLKNSPGVDSTALEINNYADIRNERDFELAMRISTSIRNGKTFYTDLNGFQMIKRVTMDKLPTQGNFYPLPGQMFIEDTHSRLSILSAQPVGCAALSQGEMEVIMDRTLTKDDNRGLGHGVYDNVYIKDTFLLLLEKKINSQSPPESSTAYPSLVSQTLARQMLHPSHFLHPKKGATKYAKYWSVGGELPCDVQLVNLRSLLTDRQPGAPHPPSSSVALILHRLGFSCSFPNHGLTCATTNGKMRLSELFPASFSEEVKQMSLSHLYEGVDMSKFYTLSLNPMALYSFKLTLSAPN